MKRKIFKGTINGKTFNSVEAYNTAMKAAVDAGQNIDAHTNYEFIDTTEDRKVIDKSKVELEELLPAMNLETTMQKVEECNGDQTIVDNLDDQLAELTNTLFEIPDKEVYKKARLNLGRLAQLKQVADKQDKILNDKYNELVKERELIDKQLNTISVTATMLDSFRSFYESVERHINRVIETTEDEPTPKPEEPKEHKHKCKCNNCQCDKESEKEETLAEMLGRLEKDMYSKLSPEEKRLADKLAEQINNVFGLNDED